MPLTLSMALATSRIPASGYFRWQQPRKATFHFIHRWSFRFAEAEKLSVATSDDGQELLFLTSVRFTHEDNDFLPVKRLGRSFRFLERFTALRVLDPGFQRHDDGSSGMRNAQEPSIGGEVVLGFFISERIGHEHEWTLRADQKERSRQATHVAHGVVGVVFRLRKKGIEIFELVRLHSTDSG